MFGGVGGDGLSAVSRSAILWGLGSILLLFLVLALIVLNGLKNDQDLRAQLLRNGERVSGKIVEIDDGSRSTHIKLEFLTLDGRHLNATYRLALNMPERRKLNEGMIVDIVYDPTDPNRAIPAPYKTIPQRDVMAELIEFFRRLGLTLLIVSPLIIGAALWKHKRVK
jgi:Protein of unknown function (DUF3592)